MTDPGQNIPVHVAVIMDGNGRWAKKRFMPRVAGHKAGVDSTRKLVEDCAKKGVGILTIFAFSSENWNRPEKEVKSIMLLFLSTISNEISRLHKKNVRVRFIGDRSRFSEKLQSDMSSSEELTSSNTGLSLNIAVNYGGRMDIVNAVHKMISKAVSGEITTTDVDERLFAQYLSLGGMPDPDLIIRTGGEQRISNFLVWQSAYSELYFTDALWPDFSTKDLEEALAWYTTRQRRFGKTSDQLIDITAEESQ